MVLPSQIQHPEVTGWGADLDLQNRPAVPRERMPQRFVNPPWDQPEPQIPRIKIYHSVERPSLTPIFGTSVPPSGLSGKMRGLAYKLSENDVRHWLLLLFADRVNMIEGIVSDILHARVPNILGEMGIRAEFKYNKRGLARKTLVVLGLITFGTVLIKTRSQKRSFALK